MKYLVVGGGCMFGLFQYHTNQKSRGVVLGGFIVGFFFFPPGKSTMDVGETLG